MNGERIGKMRLMPISMTLKKQLFSLYCEKGIDGQQSGGLCRKEFQIQIQLQSLPLRNH